MRYCDFIEVNEGFQSSVNLEYDLNKIEKVKSYIPTEQSVEILGKLLHSYYYDKSDATRASVLIGPYGRGKSHLLLVLSALTSLDLFASAEYSAEEALQVQLELCKKIRNVNETVGALAEAIVTDHIRTLPIIINSNSVDINQSFLIAIRDALERAGLTFLLPETYFDAAANMIDRWKQDYPKAISTLAETLRAKKKGIEDIYIGLKQCDQDAYSDFCECYPLVAAGTIFNPLTNMDVVKLYVSVTNALCEQTEYSGISIIFDEFSKFLEANLDKSKMLNFKVIQDMAEIAVRSGKQQIHFTCVTHKGILDYSTSDSFKTVEGRFNQIQYVASSEQSYELIANAIPKKPSFLPFVELHSDSINKAVNSASVVNVFDEMEHSAFKKKVVLGCFPLSPLSSFCLLHISELVGQNERTLFTFLAKDDKASLLEYLKEDRASVNFVNVDRIYDYFEELFRKEIFNTTVHSIWAKTTGAIQQVNAPDEISILKAIALILMIQDDHFKAIPAHIKMALMMSDDDFDTAINHLLKLHILSQRDSSEYVLLTANGVDIQNNVNNFVNSKIPRINRCEILANEFPLGTVIPREYNDRYSMLRFFKKAFIEAKVVLSYQSAEALLVDYPSDGIILYVLTDSDAERSSVREKVLSFTNVPQVIFCLSSLSVDLDSELKKVVAIQNLKKSQAAEDDHYLEEVQFFEEDLHRQIQNTIERMYSPSSKFSSYINCTGALDVIRQTDLNKAINRICLELYSQTPIINNEMVNKSVLNAQNIKGRNIVLDWIIVHSDDVVIPCMEGYGPEVSIFKSMYVHTGLDRNAVVSDAGINSVLELIERFVLASENKACDFTELYSVLLSAPYRMRKGVIPLFVAYVLRKYKEYAIIYFKGKEVELSAAVLTALNDSPHNYTLLLERGTQEREQFLNSLAVLFRQFTPQNVSSVNRVYSVIKSMQIWMRSLPEYTKKCGFYLNGGEEIELDSSIKTIRSDLLKFDVNAREMLFECWQQKLSASSNLNECLLKIEQAQRFLDEHIQNLCRELCNNAASLFSPEYCGSLPNAIKLWHEKLPEATKHHVFDSEANALLIFAQDLNSYDDYRIISELALMLTSMAIEDWSDQLARQFLISLRECLNRINVFCENGEDDQNCSLTINLPHVKVEKNFTDADISPLGQTALSNLKAVFEEYNDALEPDEQLAIIAKLISDVIQ